jgi:hypothetical protein
MALPPPVQTTPTVASRAAQPPATAFSSPSSAGPTGRQGSAATPARPTDLPSCSIGLGPISVDPCQWVTQAFLGWLGWSVDAVTSGLASLITGIAQADIFLGTPHALADQNGAVMQMTSLMQVLALAALTVLVAIGGFAIMLRPLAGLSSYEIAQFLPRVARTGVVRQAPVPQPSSPQGPACQVAQLHAPDAILVPNVHCMTCIA